MAVVKIVVAQIETADVWEPVELRNEPSKIDQRGTCETRRKVRRKRKRVH